jgi:signal transduction histidine kinase
MSVMEALANQAATAIENARLYGETVKQQKQIEKAKIDLERNVEELYMLNRVGQALASTLDLDQMLDEAYIQIKNVFDVSIFVVALYDEIKNQINVEMIVQDDKKLPKMTLNFGEGITSWVIKNKKPLLLGTNEEQQKYGAVSTEKIERKSIESVIFAPIISKNKIIGVVSIQSYKQHAFDNSNLQTLITISNQLAIAIENASLYTRLNHKLEELETFYKVSSNLTLDLQPLIQMIIDSAVQFVSSAEKGTICLLNQQTGELEVKAVSGYQTDVINKVKLKAGEGYGGKAFKEKRSFIVDITDKTVKFPGDLKEAQEIKSAIVSILEVKGEAIGVISLDNSTTYNAFNEGDLRFLISLSEQTAIAIENAILYNELQKYKSELEEKVFERTKELTQQKHELEDALNKLRDTHIQLLRTEKMASLGQIVSGVAHEINNPINFIYANISHLEEYINRIKDLIVKYDELLTKSGTGKNEIEGFKTSIDYDFIISDLENLLNTYRSGSERLRGIIQNLRTFSRMDESEFREMDIHDGINSTISLFIHQYRDRITIHKDYGNIPKVPCYVNQINQVFMNLLVNAAQAIEKSGNIWVKTEEVKDEGGNMKNEQITQSSGLRFVRISVRDDGKGIPAKVKEKIFDPFFTTKPSGQGTGLGLSISYNIVEKHKGKIYFQSPPKEVEKGTEFIIELPIK